MIDKIDKNRQKTRPHQTQSAVQYTFKTCFKFISSFKSTFPLI